MQAPPILDIFVVWHPDDEVGAERFQQIHKHFHGQAFSGLVGGAVEVYARSEPWEEGCAPRAFGIKESDQLAEGLPPAQFNVIVPILDTGLLRAADLHSSPWAKYFKSIVKLGEHPGVGIYPVVAKGLRWTGTTIYEILGNIQALPDEVNDDAGLLGRELTQAITQQIVQELQGEKGSSARLMVFISHTKQRSNEEEKRSIPTMFERVRDRIQKSHLSAFFDAQDIQPGEAWQATLNNAAGSSALLMIRTDVYAAREWTQREVYEAKRKAMPVVCMYALTAGEERGSFLMDHVPSIVCDTKDPVQGIEVALNRLVDETLKSVLWKAQSAYLGRHGFDWLPAQSPEPVTFAEWLENHQREKPNDQHLWVIHPDPPLGSAEHEALQQICAIAGYRKANLDILTPRTFAARGGALQK